jgi:hypothetical protein
MHLPAGMCVRVRQGVYVGAIHVGGRRGAAAALLAHGEPATPCECVLRAPPRASQPASQRSSRQLRKHTRKQASLPGGLGGAGIRQPCEEPAWRHSLGTTSGRRSSAVAWRPEQAPAAADCRCGLGPAS